VINRYLRGDLRQTELNFIAHGVNCQNVMGSGVARALFEKYPEVKEQYHKYFETAPIGAENLGKVQFVKINPNLTILNLFTQNKFGQGDQIYVDYIAISNIFSTLNRMLHGKSLAIPKIGAGLAGGDWREIERIVDDATPNLDITVYYL